MNHSNISHVFHRFPIDFPGTELAPEVVNLKSFVPDLGRFLVRPWSLMLIMFSLITIVDIQYWILIYIYILIYFLLIF